MKVRIQCSQKVYYNQVVEMTKAEFKELKKTPTRELEDQHMSPLTIYLDVLDIHDGGEFDDFDIEEVKKIEK